MSQHGVDDTTGNRIRPDKIWTRDFILIVMSNFLVFLGFHMTLPTIPLFVEELGGNDQLIGIVVGIFTFSALLLRPYAGHALESKGRRFVYLFGLGIFVISVGSFGFVPGLFFLFIVRIVQGVGWGFSTTASGTIATDLIPPRRRGEGMGYYGLSGTIALALGPTLGLALTGFISFKILFLFCSLLGLMAFILSFKIRYKQVDPVAVQQPHKKWDIYEKSALPPSLLLFFLTVTFGGIATFLPLYSSQKGIEGIQWYFLLYALALMLSRTFSGKIYDQKGHKAVFVQGALLIVISMGLLSWLPNSLILYIAAILYGLGFGTVQPALQAWSVKEAPIHRRGMANATFFSFFDLGVGIGAIAFGQIGHWFGYSAIYMASAISVLFSIILYLFIVARSREHAVSR
ncbi:MFS transporter [Bacillus sp. DTU_2020_1000418_1_SI_GHA_SEK_038]|uniref:MFS transporter n=1 Tax=Bacillus sp. DTU_2020_1000418_1_SI_GHA_SEK_038 TaxID=3077585 RepID=UPI0028E98782|nr:MFS transporter [Bacillus sp. DTU_2020_1000418_1_SI_GHA_SEK_038]WNS73592.1 MFS transporter [Bacillus sp. DTU_2020_1000418_1_SI_GHA_SEK_038]